MKKYKIDVKSQNGFRFTRYVHTDYIYEAFFFAADLVKNGDKAIKIKEVKK